MKISDNILKNDERAIFALRSLYGRYGYRQYKMSKFEEYDLYARNKDFLISDNVITFTDTNGKLMALKPDVTLSIIKNSKDAPGSVEKVYYNENVYRISKGSHSFREIMQLGLECIGDIDNYCISEAVTLAAMSLQTISKRCVLDVSHLGIISELIDALLINDEYRAKLIKCIGEKNVHGVRALCEEAGAYKNAANTLIEVISCYGSPGTVFAKLDKLLGSSYSLCELKEVIEALPDTCRDIVHIDFSVVSDMKYYNGVVFKGFVDGIPQSVLSGGQYDRLMKRMGAKSRAIGFAVYLDMLEELDTESKAYDIDALLIYTEKDAPCEISAAVEKLCGKGMSVWAVKKVPEDIRYKTLYKLQKGEVCEDGNA